MASALDYALTLSNSGFLGPLAVAGQGVGAFAGAIGGLASDLSNAAREALGLQGGLTDLLKSAMVAASGAETTQVAFTTLVGSAGRAAAVLQDIRTLGAQTPFEFPELATAARSLIAFGEQAERAPAVLRMIGDVASGIQAPIGEIATIYGKARVAGTLFSQDINELTGRGIPVIQQFAKQLGVSDSEVKKMAEQGKITFPMLEKAFVDLTGKGGQFYQMMQAQSGTAEGKLSNLKDAIGQVLTTIGTPINDALKPVLDDAGAAVQRFGAGLAAAVQIGRAAMAQGKFGEMLSLSLKIGAQEGTNYLVGSLGFAAKFFETALITGFGVAAAALSGGMNSQIATGAIGLMAVFDGLATYVRGSLGAPFQWIAATFSATIETAADQIAEKLGKIPGLGKAFEGFQAETFETHFNRAMKANDPADVRARGEEEVRGGIMMMGDALKGAAANAETLWKAQAGNLKFEAAKVFDTGDLRKQLGDLATAVDPAGMKALQGAFSGLQSSSATAAASLGAMAGAANQAAAATKKANPEDDKPRTRIKSFGLEDTLLREYARLGAERQNKMGGLAGYVSSQSSTRLSTLSKSARKRLGLPDDSPFNRPEDRPDFVGPIKPFFTTDLPKFTKELPGTKKPGSILDPTKTAEQMEKATRRFSRKDKEKNPESAQQRLERLLGEIAGSTKDTAARLNQITAK